MSPVKRFAACPASHRLHGRPLMVLPLAHAALGIPGHELRRRLDTPTLPLAHAALGIPRA